MVLAGLPPGRGPRLTFRTGYRLLLRQLASKALHTAAPAALPNGEIAKQLIGGVWSASKSTKTIPVHNPATQEVVTIVPESTQTEMQAAVAAAKAAFPAWAATPLQVRVRVMLEYQALLRKNQREIAKLITLEQGKTLADAEGDVFRGLEVVEFACSAGTLLGGETMQNLSAGVDILSYREPLGVCAGIAPFNFPAMIPLWMFPIAITAGNTYVLKPSERTPSAAQRLVELAEQAGVPKGVVNIIHGGVDAVNFLCDAPDVRAISFVGGSVAGRHIYTRATANGKRAQINAAAKSSSGLAVLWCGAPRPPLTTCCLFVACLFVALAIFLLTRAQTTASFFPMPTRRTPQTRWWARRSARRASAAWR